ncbi:hypothetical protein PV05_05477 [Exophiala xenobiotica]|uniref:Uncharacterized protein n=1 Tax=Exophiala xenobiotica TaxID=348802 RepID=A0A0D2EN65_9EURO|nr:uncharacterized protein PV05_05477 [Exophiala xenobiotica]KIW56858.1 hypothetical protein PV05_05477 [Exophiala xenobiotica]
MPSARLSILPIRLSASASKTSLSARRARGLKGRRPRERRRAANNLTHGLPTSISRTPPFDVRIVPASTGTLLDRRKPAREADYGDPDFACLGQLGQIDRT